MRDGIENLSEVLLNWYDRNARELPWRVPPAAGRKGALPDPYHIWLSEVMLQQTTVAAVTGYFLNFTRKWPTVFDLACADDEEVMAAWAGLGYYARARNLLKCARLIVERYNGRFPDTQKELVSLPGIGPYTSAAVSAIAFGRPETVMDGNVERVMARLFAIETPLPHAKKSLFDCARRLTPQTRAGDYAQAVMDLGATICTPKSPSCASCPLLDHCMARELGLQQSLPRRTDKKPKPVLQGVAYVAIREDGALLLERRPPRGLLGGMLGWPGGEWAETPSPNPPLATSWETLTGEVRHTFTHFHLRLQVQTARVPLGTEPNRGFFVPADQFKPGELPTLMVKVFELTQKS